MSDLYISWTEYYQKIETLALKIYQSNWQFDQIVCLAKGGLRVGDILCRLFDKPLGILSASSYGGVGNQTRGNIIFSQHLSMTTETLGKRILLVDDLVDSGITFQETIKWLNQHYPNQIEEIKTAVIWYKSCSIFAPDYYLEYLTDNPWIYQPFERYDTVKIADLAENR